MLIILCIICMKHRFKLIFFLIAVTLAGLVAITLWPQASSVDRPSITIGVIASLTGTGAARGESVVHGLQLALEKIQRDKLLPDFELKLEVQDVPLDEVSRMPAAFNFLTDVKHVSAIIGPMGSDLALAIAPLVDEKKIPVIAHTASTLRATTDNYFMLRFWPTAHNYADAILTQLNKLGYRRIASITSINNNTADLRQVLVARFAGSSPPITFVFDEQVTPDEKDFRTLLTKIKQQSFDALFLNLFEGQIGLVAQQARQLGIAAPIFTNSVTTAAEFEVADPKFLEGAWFPRFAGYGEVGRQAFIQRFGKESVNPESATAAHDALLALAEAINQVGDNPQAITGYLYQAKFTGLIGQFYFLPSGDAVIPIGLRQIRNGEIVELEP